MLLVNLGSPDAPATGAVRRYLRQFLSDPRVIDLPAVPRWLLLNLVILPLRPKRSAAAYRKVWMADGAPLKVYSQQFLAAIRAELGDRFEVELGMRYRNPSIAAAVEALVARGVDRLVVFPLYGQYASSSTGSTVAEVYRVLGQRWNVPFATVVPPFFDDPGYVAACADVARESLDGFDAEHVLFSYHGLPERQVKKSDPSGAHCLERDDCCAALQAANRSCYRAHCFETTRRVVAELELEVPWTVCFQSRLGRTPWIRPYTDVLVRDLALQGVKRALVVSGSFVADCLETLEELGIRARDDFRAAGGDELRLVPSLNARPAWVKAAADLVRRSASGFAR